jgi:SAM-dependent methyltransferase/uncharacterized protein YbaR (Trm112 family)
MSKNGRSGSRSKQHDLSNETQSMQKIVGFPRSLLPLLRCVSDSGQLSVCHEDRSDDVGIADGTIRCAECSREYQIECGIVRLMPTTLTTENQHEISLLNQSYGAMSETYTPPASGWRSDLNDHEEIPAHLNLLQLSEGHRVLEMGCGDGRLTVLMAQLGADLLAVDFSIAALERNQANLSSGVAPTSYRVTSRRSGDLTKHVGLVHADASNVHFAPRSFDRAVSATPLDSRDERMKMYRAVAESLTEDGRYVAGVEYDDFYRRLFGLPVMRRYTPGGVLIEHLDMPELRRETAAYFSRLRMQFIRVHLPFMKRLPLSVSLPVTRAASAVPIVKHFAQILLVCARRPIRIPPEGARRSGHLGAKNLYRWYKRRRGEEPMWDCGEPV